MTPADDPRLDPNQLAILPSGMEGVADALLVPDDYEAALQIGAMLGMGYAPLLASMADLNDYTNADKQIHHTTGGDGHEVPLHVYTPSGGPTSKTCYYKTHGGGMAFLAADSPHFETEARFLSQKHHMTGC